MEQRNCVRLADFVPANTALCMLDMINGFAVEGALASPRINALIRPIAAAAAACDKAGIEVVALADCHDENSPEFASYPPHCLRGSAACEICAEIDRACRYTLIEKGSTNGWLEPAMQTWISAHPQIDTFLVVGNCTDICVYQFAVTAKTWFTRQNKPVRVIVPADLTDTFDAPDHPADALKHLFLQSMAANGIDVIDTLEV